MERKQKLFWAKTGVILSAIPVLLWAHEYGPDVGYSGVPKENGTCTASGCHLGTTNSSSNHGSVTVNFPNGTTYTPGVKQHITVTIADPAQRAWGFQLTAREASNTAAMAGAFASTDGNTLVMCGATNVDANTEQELDFPHSQTCPATKPLSYIEHSLAGYNSTRGQANSATYQFDWTPPATDVGNITIYVAGNAANGDLTTNGDHIYATTYTLTSAPAAGGGTPPAITDVQNGASFQPGIVPGSWITIKGSNLSSVTDTWDKAIVDGKLPTTLDGVSVSVGGQPAYVYYVSSGQINVVAPNIGTGNMQVTVTNGGVTSSASSATSSTVQPAFFLWNGKYAVATHLDGTLAVANGTFPGATTVPAKPGEYVVLWGTGFGSTSPAAPAGAQVPSDQIYSTAGAVTVTVGGTPATVYSDHAALAPGFAGLYQMAVQIPATAPNGDLPLAATIDGAQTPAGVSISVHN